MKEFEVVIKVRNNLLKQRREELGLTTVQFAEAVGIAYATYIKLESMNDSPTKKNGDWRDSAIKIAAYHGVSPDELFPPVIQAVKKPTVTRQLSAAQVETFLSEYQQRAALPADVEFEERERNEQVADALQSLSPRERFVLTRRFGLDDADPKTFGEVGEEMGVSSARAAQLGARALNKLRRPFRAQQIADYVQEGLSESEYLEKIL